MTMIRFSQPAVCLDVVASNRDQILRIVNARSVIAYEVQNDCSVLLYVKPSRSESFEKVLKRMGYDVLNLGSGRVSRGLTRQPLCYWYPTQISSTSS